MLAKKDRGCRWKAGAWGFTEDLLSLILDCSWTPGWAGADQDSIELVVLRFKKQVDVFYSKKELLDGAVIETGNLVRTKA